MDSPVMKLCPDGTSFDGNLGSCEINGICITVSCMFTTGSVFVSFGPDSPYYAWCSEDVNANPTLKRCPDGMWFNSDIEQCEMRTSTTTESITTTTTASGSNDFVCTDDGLFPGEILNLV
jgi:Chitin binding Peritrophin-A domain